MPVDTQDLFGPLPQLQPRRRKEAGISAGDIGKSLVSGAQELVGSLGSIPETIGAASGSQPLERAGQQFRQKHQQAVAERAESMTPAGQEAFNAGITDVGVLGFGGDVPLSRFLAIQGARALPSTAAAGGGGLALRTATKGAIGLGAGSVATEAGLSAASGAAQQATDIENRSTANLLQTSETFRRAYEKHANLPSDERDMAARSELKGVALLTGATGNALATLGGSALAGRVLKGAAGGVFDESVTASTGLLKAGTKGAGREAVQEFSQSALESIAQDLTTGTFVDPQAAKLDNLLVNALESGVEGAVIGSAVGGTIGGVTGQVNATRQARMEKAIQRREELAAAEREKAEKPLPTPKQSAVDDAKVAAIVEGANLNGRVDSEGKVQDTIPLKVLGSSNRATLQAAAKQLEINTEGLDDAALVLAIRRKAGDLTALTPDEQAAVAARQQEADIEQRLRDAANVQEPAGALTADALAARENAEPVRNRLNETLIGKIIQGVETHGTLDDNPDSDNFGKPRNTLPIKELQRANRATLQEAARRLGLDVDNLDDAELLLRIRRFAGDTDAITTAEQTRATALQESVAQAPQRRLDDILNRAVSVDGDTLQPSKPALARIRKNLAAGTTEKRIDGLKATIAQFEKNRNNTDNADVAKRVLADLTGQPVAAPVEGVTDADIEAQLAAAADVQEPAGGLTADALAFRDAALTSQPAIPQTQVNEQVSQAPENSGLIEDEVIPTFEINGKTVPASVTDMKEDRSLKKAALFKYGRDNGIDVKAKDTRDTLIEKLVASTEPPVEGDTGPINFSTNEDSAPTQGEAIAAALGESDTDDKAPPATGQTEANLGVENVNEINDKQTEANLGTGALPERLTNAADRDAARTLLAGEVKTKQDHVKLAKVLDIHVTSRDTKQQIADKIIEVTVGARLKTEAIRGDTLRREPKSQQQAEANSGIGALTKRIANAAGRNEAYALLEKEAKTKQDLIKVAQYLAIAEPSRKSKQTLIDSIIEATLGARLRAEILQDEMRRRESKGQQQAGALPEASQETPPVTVNNDPVKATDAVTSPTVDDIVPAGPEQGLSDEEFTRLNIQDTARLMRLDRASLERVAKAAGVDRPQNYAKLPLIAEIQTEGTGINAVLANKTTLKLLAASRNAPARRPAVTQDAEVENLLTELTDAEVEEFVTDIRTGEDAHVVQDIERLSSGDVNKLIKAMQVKAIDSPAKLIQRAKENIIQRSIKDGLHAAEARQMMNAMDRTGLNGVARKLKIKQRGMTDTQLREAILAVLPEPVATRLNPGNRGGTFQFRAAQNSVVPSVPDAQVIEFAKALNAAEQTTLTDLIRKHPEVVGRSIHAGRLNESPPSEILQNMVETVQIREQVLDEYTRSYDLGDASDVAAADRAAHREAMKNVKLSTLPDGRDGTGIADPNDGPQPISRELLQETLTPFRKAGVAKIHIAESVDQLPKAGQELVASVAKGHLTRGLFLSRETTGSEDQIWLLAPNIHSPREAVFVVLHEAAHKGMRKVFGDRMNRALLDIYDRNQMVRDRVAQYQQDLLNNRTGESLAVLQRSPATLKLLAIEEVLADMAKVGEARSVNLFSRIYNTVSAWLYDKFGINFNLTNAAVEEIVAGATDAGLAADSQVLNAQKPLATIAPDIRLSTKPKPSPAQAMDKVDGYLKSAVQMAESNLPSVTGWLNQAKLALSTGNFLASYHARIFNQEIQDAITQQNRAERVASATIAKHGKDLSAREQEMARLPEKAQATFNELAGESTRLGIYPDRPFDNQKWLHGKNEAKNRQLYVKLKNMYQQPGIKDVYDKALKHNERDLEMTFGSLLRSIAFTFDIPKEQWRKVNPQDAVSDDARVRARFDDAVKDLETLIEETGGEPAKLTIKNMRDFRASRLQGPYFHLGRYGDYFVQYDIAQNPEAQQAVQAALKASGLRNEAFVSEDAKHVFHRFESISSYTTQVNMLKELEAAGHIDKLSDGKIEENLSKLDFTNVGFMQNVLVKIDTNSELDPEQKAQHKELIRRTMVEMLPEMSGGKALARRKGTPGYSLDMRRNFVRRSRANMFFVAQNTAQPEVMDALKSFRGEIKLMQDDPAVDQRLKVAAQDMFNHIKKRHNNALKPLSSPMLDQMSSLGYSMFLASNIPYIVANMAQPFQTTLPVLGGKFGFTKTASEMFGTYGKISKILKDTVSQGWVDGQGWKGVLDAHIIVDRAGLTKQQNRAMHILVDSGVVEFTQAHGLARVEQGADARNTGVPAKVFGMMSHYSEAANRMVTGLAAFNLEFERLKKANRNVSEDELVLEAARFAEFTIDRTQFNYDPANRGYAFSKDGVFGKLTPLFTGFMQFNMQMIQLLVDLSSQSFNAASDADRLAARKSLAGILASTMVLSGAMGLPFMTAIAAVYNGLGDDDDPRELRADFTNFLSDMLGADAANVIAHGAIDPLTGATLSTRLSLGELLPASEFLRDRRDFSDKLDSLALSTLGPSVGAMANILTGASKMMDGDIFKGMAMMLPAALQGTVKGTDLLVNGYTDMKGNKLPIAATDWEIMMQFLNFTPAIKTELQRNARSFTTQNRLLAARKTELGRDMVKAIESGDQQKINAKAAELIAFMTRNPDLGEFDLARIITNQQRKLGLAQALETPGATSVRDAYRLQTAFSGLPTAALRERLAEGR